VFFLSNDYLKYINNLPVIPEIAIRVMNIAEDGLNISFRELENIIRVDPGLTAKILKIANSALYARQNEIKSLQIAISMLGFKNIKSLVLLVTASSFFHHAKKTKFYNDFWRHSITTAFLGKIFSLHCQKTDIAENVFSSGLLHNIGKTVLFNVDPPKYERLLVMEKEGKEPTEVYEEQLFGINHRKIGAELFKRWNFPDLFIDIALEHNSLNITSPFKSIIIYVTVSSLLTEKFGYGIFTPFNEENYLELLKRDPLFLECHDLFGVR
jgi:HD-like signal output (HDOD) protein